MIILDTGVAKAANPRKVGRRAGLLAFGAAAFALPAAAQVKTTIHMPGTSGHAAQPGVVEGSEIYAGQTVEWASGGISCGKEPCSIDMTVTGAPGTVIYRKKKDDQDGYFGQEETTLIKTTKDTAPGTYSVTTTYNWVSDPPLDPQTYTSNLTVDPPLPPKKDDPKLTLSRSNLTTVQATGTPDGGTFSYNTATLSGANISTFTTPDLTSNPNIMTFADPANPSATGAPTAGGLGSYTASYSANGMTANAKKDDPFSIPVFGMSCYYTALESDWGSADNNTCKSLTLHHKKYMGTVDTPDGYPGTYCSSFIAEVVLQGSAVTNAGNNIQYNAGAITQVDSIKAADGTAVVAGQTVARDRHIIPSRAGVLVDVDQVGTGLTANDTGGAIKGYRLDFYQGAGQGVCAGYTNPMAVGACTPKQDNCPGSNTP